MEVCQLECDHRKGTVFGVDLSVLLRDRSLAVPFVVTYCTAEIERRALSVEVEPAAARAKRTARRWDHDGDPLCVSVSLS